MNYYERIQKSINYIESNLENQIVLEEVSNNAFMSSATFYRVFFSMVGYSVKEYIRLRRLSLAADELLSGGVRIIDLAIKYSYTSADSFSRAFKNVTGLSPTDFRKQKQCFKFKSLDITDKYFEIQDSLLLEKYPDIKVLKKLEPFKVAYYTAYSKTPENDAFKVIKSWAKKNGMLSDNRGCRVFGFDAPDSKPGDEVYGYEAWITIPEDFIFEDDKVKTKQVEGGLYAVTSTTIGEIVSTWDRFREWIKMSKYGLGNHQFLEEHLPFDEWDKFKSQQDYKIDLYMPLTEKKAKQRETIEPVEVAYYRECGPKDAPNEAWRVIINWAKNNNIDLNSQEHKIYVFNSRNNKKCWYEIMVTVDKEMSISDEKVKKKIFDGGCYITDCTNFSNLPKAWDNMIRWFHITKTKFGRHQWVEEWMLKDWILPAEKIKIYSPILLNA